VRRGWHCGHCPARGETNNGERAEREVIQHYSEIHPALLAGIKLLARQGMFTIRSEYVADPTQVRLPNPLPWEAIEPTPAEDDPEDEP